MNTYTDSEKFFPQALAWLQHLSRHQIRPQQAREMLAQLRTQAPYYQLELVWENPGANDDTHYDLLVMESGGTTSLSYCTDSDTPWPLRGAQRWRDNDVVRVNGELVDVETLMAKLDFIWSDTRLLARLIDDKLIGQEVARRNIRLTDAELQQALNAFRMDRGLNRLEDTLAWLTDRGLTHERLERHVEAVALAEKLKTQIAAGEEQVYFETHRDQFDEVSVITIDGNDLSGLSSLRQQLLNEEPDHWLVPIQTAIQAGRLDIGDVVCRRLSKQDLEAFQRTMTSASPHEAIIGPNVIGIDNYRLMIVLARHPAQFNGTVRAVCRQALFDTWLAQHREIADVEWLWGPGC